MIIKEGIESEWRVWREKFLETFANIGWNIIAYAHAYKYKEGLLIDYAIKKEQLMLQANRSIDIQQLIDTIVIGLPEIIRDKINRDEIKTSTDLFHEIRKHENMMYRRNYTKTNDNKSNFKRKSEEKKPCKTCEKLNKGIRYHPEEAC